MEDTGMMSQYRADTNSPLEQLRKIVEPPTRQSLNARIEALSNEQRKQLHLLVSQLKLSMAFTRKNDKYKNYHTLISSMYPKLSLEFSELISEVMESLDPTPVMPAEVRHERALKQTRKRSEDAMSIYNKPEYFPPTDSVEIEQNSRTPIAKLEPSIEPNPLLSRSNEDAFGFDSAALNTFKDTLGKIESSNDYSVRGGFNNHYLGKYQMGKAALEDVGIGYSKEEQEEFLSNPAKQEKAFEKFTKQNHEYLQRKSETYRDLSASEKLAVLGYAHNQGRGGALKFLETGETEQDGFGTDALTYIEKVTNALGSG